MNPTSIPDDPGARWDYYMRHGDFSAAWDVSARILAERGPSPASVPRHLQQVWDGTPLTARNVLVRCYHGLGDTIQFIRFVPRLRQIAGSVTVWAQPELIPILRRVPGVGRIEPLHDAEPDIDRDVDVEVMELPFILRITPDDLPGNIPYICMESVEPAPSTMRRVGIVHSVGNWDKKREIPIALFERLIAEKSVELIAIRPNGAIPSGMTCAPPDATATIEDTARLIQELDLLITVDSMPAHLAGALGRTVWTLLRKHADWRWMNKRDDSPWYPTMRLFRQQTEGDWAAVIDDVAAALDDVRPGSPSADLPAPAIHSSTDSRTA